MSVAYLFPGQGSQHVGMGVDVAASCPESADVYDRASAAVGYDLLAVCRSAADAVLRRTEISQPAVLATSLALLAAAPWLPRPSVVAGHSLGEYTALVATGAMNLEDAVGLVRHRGELMNRATRDRDVVMAAVLGLDKATVNDLCRRAEPAGCCQPAAYNAPTQTVVAGDRAAVQLLIEWAETAGARCSQLPVSSAFHTTLMAPIAADLHSYLANIAITDPQVPVISNVVAEGVQDAAHLRRLLISQLDQPVRWAETIAQLRVAGVDTVIAFGPGPVAGALCRANDRRLALSTIMDVHTLHTARARFVRSTRTPVPADERSTDEHDRLDRAVLAAAAHCPPDRPALVSVSTTVRFGELADRSGHCRAGLASAGIGTGDRVVVFLPNGPDLVIVLLALWQLGAIVVAALPAHRQRELAHLCDASGAVAIIVDGGGGRRSRLDTARRVRGSRLGLRNLFLVGSAGQAPGELQLPTGTGESVTGVMNTEGIPPVPGEPIALLLASGGSTGLPKLIPRTHLDYLHNVRISTAICRLDKHAVYLAALPALHNFTLGCPGILGTLLAGGTVVFAAHPDVATLHSSLRFHNATITALVPQLAVAVAAASAATEENCRRCACCRSAVRACCRMPHARFSGTCPDGSSRSTAWRRVCFALPVPTIQPMSLPLPKVAPRQWRTRPASSTWAAHQCDPASWVNCGPGAHTRLTGITVPAPTRSLRTAGTARAILLACTCPATWS